MMNFKNLVLANLLFISFIQAQLSKDSLEKISYNFRNMPIDVVIPCHKKDLPTLDLVIKGIRDNLIGLNRIIVISKERLTGLAEWFDEQKFPFTKEAIAFEIFQNKEYAKIALFQPRTNIGWIYQQLLKLYSPLIIPGISENVLVIDADTILLNPMNLLDKNGSGIFNPGEQYHLPYFEHMARLVPGLKRQFKEHSGISNIMLFQKPVIEDLFNIIEKIHNCAPWQAFCRTIDYNRDPWCVSEYEIYFNFAISRSSQFGINKLKWAESGNLNDIVKYKKEHYDYVSFHSWMRGICQSLE